MKKFSNKITTGLLFVTMLLTTLAFNAQASEVVKSGQFEGRSDHITTGGVSILKTKTATLIVLENNFSLDGAPDPRVGFGKNGFVKSSIVSKLKNKKGEQVYVLPKNINVSEYNEIYIWCNKFGVPLSVASLK